MIPIHYIRDHQQEVNERLAKRGKDFEPLLNKVLEADDRRRSIQKEMDDALAEINKASKEIGQLFQSGKRNEAESRKSQVSTLKEKSGELQESLRGAEQDLRSLLVQIPNAPHMDVPAGTNAEANVVVREVGNKPTLGGGALPHWDLAAKYGIIDFELGNKITGSGFPVYVGKGRSTSARIDPIFLGQGGRKWVYRNNTSADGECRYCFRYRSIA